MTRYDPSTDDSDDSSNPTGGRVLIFRRRNEPRMDMMTLGAWALTIVVVGAAAIALRGLFTRPTDLDAGAVSQSWLTEHRAGKGERFS
jgi:hypothetical protein